MSTFISYYGQVCAQQVAMAAQAKRIQVLEDALEYIAKFGSFKPEHLVKHCVEALHAPEGITLLDKELADNIANNKWDNIDDFLVVLARQKEGKWHWYSNTKCKYVELRWICVMVAVLSGIAMVRELRLLR